ncbi:SDR family NAD(P)-dependent oxidoreductase [Streptomyces griseosporeus]|jgi:NAD(P)-dependent dehydrogenase (short-subunit alcohol dehydrogenase family)|uniref:SDR family NAD(P)-dependent oxidoreductase n=1 Tax=Streptomyces griseosporeus TaxID=1910 RepID=UPI0036BD9641
MAHARTLTGRVVLVTGEGDLAAALATGLLAHGAVVALAGPDAGEIRGAAPPESRLLALPPAPDGPAGPARAVDTVVGRLGRLDHLVNLVAARPGAGPLMELDPLALQGVLHRDLVTPLACTQRAYRRWMAAHGGSVVNVVAETAGSGPRNIALGGLTELTEWLAAELAPLVQVHTLMPSPSLGTAAYHEGAARVLCDLLTLRTDPADGPVLVLSEEPACPSMAA